MIAPLVLHPFYFVKGLMVTYLELVGGLVYG